MEPNFKRGDRVRIVSGLHVTNGRTGTVCCRDDLYNAIGVVRDDGVKGGGQHGCYLVNVDGLEIVSSATAPTADDVRVGRVYAIGGNTWRVARLFTDAAGTERYDSTQCNGPNETCGTRVDLLHSWLAEGVAKWVDAALDSDAATATAAHLSRVTEEQAQQIDRLVAERNAARVEVAQLRHQLGLAHQAFDANTALVRVMTNHDVELRDDEEPSVALNRALDDLDRLRSLERRVIADRSPARFVEVGCDVQHGDEV